MIALEAGDVLVRHIVEIGLIRLVVAVEGGDDDLLLPVRGLLVELLDDLLWLHGGAGTALFVRERILRLPTPGSGCTILSEVTSE